MKELKSDAREIISESIAAVLPDEAVKRALSGKVFPGRVILVAIGKAAWQMAKAAYDCLGEDIEKGIIITKYGHSRGTIGSLECVEAGHPVPDENSFRGAARALELVSGLSPEDTVLFLVSGGGSALFELPLIPGDRLECITSQMLAAGMDIVSMNTIRKRLSAVKGGKFALACAPAQVFSIVLSDILGDPLDMIASGPAAADRSTSAEALALAEQYGLQLMEEELRLLQEETPKSLDRVQSFVTGSVHQLCEAAAVSAEKLGYRVVRLSEELNIEASDAGRWMASFVKNAPEGNTAWIAGGETVVHLRGNGKGGRNQELALAAAVAMQDYENALLFSVGSDGSDGPTDAAGGMVDGMTAERLRLLGMEPEAYLADNDSYTALKAADALIVTGPTGTNVNDLTVLLVRK